MVSADLSSRNSKKPTFYIILIVLLQCLHITCGDMVMNLKKKRWVGWGGRGLGRGGGGV